MESHEYHTDYCRLLLDEKKRANLLLLKAAVEDPIAALLHSMTIRRRRRRKRRRTRIRTRQGDSDTPSRPLFYFFSLLILSGFAIPFPCPYFLFSSFPSPPPSYRHA